MEGKNLQLSLKTKWFEMTKAGIKTEDYREITLYWTKRFVNFHRENMDSEGFVDYINNDKSNRLYLDNISFKKFDNNTMTLGYPKATDTERIIRFEHSGIEIRTGNPDWGAEPNKLYFVIKHGKRHE